jgi:hypothetical protein
MASIFYVQTQLNLESTVVTLRSTTPTIKIPHILSTERNCFLLFPRPRRIISLESIKRTVLITDKEFVYYTVRGRPGSTPGMSMWDLMDKVALRKVFLPELRVCSVVIAPMRHTRHLHVTLTKRTNGQSLGTFQCSFGNWALHIKYSRTRL